MWIKTESRNQRPRNVWRAEVMADHYDSRYDTPEWHETDDGYRKANWKAPVAEWLVENRRFEPASDEQDDGANDAASEVSDDAEDVVDDDQHGDDGPSGDGDVDPAVSPDN